MGAADRGIEFARVFLVVVVVITLAMGGVQAYILAQNGGTTHRYGWINVAAVWALIVAGVLAIVAQWTRYGNQRWPILAYSAVAALAVVVMVAGDALRGRSLSTACMLIAGAPLPISVIHKDDMRRVGAVLLLLCCQLACVML